MPFLAKSTKLTDADARDGKGIHADNAFLFGGDTYIPQSAPRESSRRIPQRNTDRQVCANPECTGRWQMPWKNRRRPIFEGRWGCSSRCLESVIRKALRRERGDLRSSVQEDTEHRHRIPLGLVMLSQGWITQSQLRRALDAQRTEGTGRIGDWLVQECGLLPAQVTRGLAAQWSCPVLPPDGFAPSAMALTMPRLFVEEFGLLPLRVAASRILYLAFNNRLDASAAFAVEQMNGLRVESGLLDDHQFQAARSRMLKCTFVRTRLESFVDADNLSAKIATILEQTQPIASRLVRMHHHYWLRTWLETGSYSGVGTLPATGEDIADTIFTCTIDTSKVADRIIA